MLLVIIGVVLLLGMVLWSLPVIGYLAFAEKIRDITDPIFQMPSFAMRLMLGTVFGSALCSLVFGLGLLCSAGWARLGAIVFLFIQFVALLFALSIAVNGFTDPDGGTISLLSSPAQGYLGAVGVTVVNGVLITLLLLARRKKAG